MSLYLGIDGASIKTTAIVANEHGKVLAKTVLSGKMDGALKAFSDLLIK